MDKQEKNQYNKVWMKRDRDRKRLKIIRHLRNKKKVIDKKIDNILSQIK